MNYLCSAPDSVLFDFQNIIFLFAYYLLIVVVNLSVNNQRKVPLTIIETKFSIFSVFYTLSFSEIYFFLKIYLD